MIAASVAPLPENAVRTIDDYIALEKVLAELLCNGPVHFWGSELTGVWVESQGQMQLFDPWMRSNEAITTLAIEYDTWAQPYPAGMVTDYEGKYFDGNKFVSIFVSLIEHPTKEHAYRYAILESVIAQIKKTRAAILAS